MHYWGDEWFQKYGDELYSAIEYVEKELHKYHIGVCGKEKWGAYRDSFLSFWNGSLYQILFGYRIHIGSFHKYPFKWMENLADKFHWFIYYVVDDGYTKKYFRLIDEWSHHLHDDKKDEYFQRIEDYEKKRWWKGIKYYTEKCGLRKLVNDHQAEMYNKVFQTACKKYPNVIEELIVDLDGYEMIKPGPFGSIDGVAIHNKYWKKI